MCTEKGILRSLSVPRRRVLGPNHKRIHMQNDAYLWFKDLKRDVHVTCCSLTQIRCIKKDAPSFCALGA